jgi:hypothetical protein
VRPAVWVGHVFADDQIELAIAIEVACHDRARVCDGRRRQWSIECPIAVSKHDQHPVGPLVNDLGAILTEGYIKPAVTVEISERDRPWKPIGAGMGKIAGTQREGPVGLARPVGFAQQHEQSGLIGEVVVLRDDEIECRRC